MTDNIFVELQAQYQGYKNTLQTIAQKIGDIEQETEEHRCAKESLRCTGVAIVVFVADINLLQTRD